MTTPTAWSPLKLYRLGLFSLLFLSYGAHTSDSGQRPSLPPVCPLNTLMSFWVLCTGSSASCHCDSSPSLSCASLVTMDDWPARKRTKSIHQKRCFSSLGHLRRELIFRESMLHAERGKDATLEKLSIMYPPPDCFHLDQDSGLQRDYLFLFLIPCLDCSNKLLPSGDLKK